jgi:hypothetical protein
MASSRYALIDEYTLEELRRAYQAADASERIQLLEQFPKADDAYDSKAIELPFEIARMAASDENALVRQWIVRHGTLSDLRRRGDAWVDLFRPLVEQLIRDPDEFVRACLYENQTVFSSNGAENAFICATHVERLALMRNPRVAKAEKLIREIFDPDNKELEEGLKIGFEQRKELALAFVSNPEAQKDSRSDLDNEPYFRVDGYAYFSTRERWATIWKLAAKWPSESGVPHAVYRSLVTEDEVKAEVYQQSSERGPRISILESCRGDQQTTIKLGISDSDGVCRYIAYSKIWWINLGPAGLEAVLSGDDKEALGGLAQNESLPVEVLEQIASKLEGLGKATGDYLGHSFAERTIDRVRERQSSPTGQLPEELAKMQDLLKDLESAIESVRSGKHSTKGSFKSDIYSVRAPQNERPPRRDSRSNWIIAILLAMGVALILDAPLGASLGLGLIGVALALYFGK